MLSLYQQSVIALCQLVVGGAMAGGICFGYAFADLIERVYLRRRWRRGRLRSA